MGNTLLDFHQGLTDDEKDHIGLKNMCVYLKSQGLSYSVEVLKEKFLDVLYGQFHLRESQLIEIDVREILNHFIELSDNQQNDLLRVFYRPYADYVVVHEGAKDLLSELKKRGKYIGVVSNCFLPAFIYKEIFKRTGLDDFIDDYTFSYTYKIRKPNPDLFKLAFQYDYSESIMIGDGFKPDIKGSGQLGVDSIWYNHKMRSIKATPHLKLIITSLLELL